MSAGLAKVEKARKAADAASLALVKAIREAVDAGESQAAVGRAANLTRSRVNQLTKSRPR